MFTGKGLLIDRDRLVPPFVASRIRITSGMGQKQASLDLSGQIPAEVRMMLKIRHRLVLETSLQTQLQKGLSKFITSILVLHRPTTKHRKRARPMCPSQVYPQPHQPATWDLGSPRVAVLIFQQRTPLIARINRILLRTRVQLSFLL